MTSEKKSTFNFFHLAALLLISSAARTFAQIHPKSNDGAIPRCRCYSDEFLAITNSMGMCLSEPIYYPDVVIPSSSPVQFQMTVLVDDWAFMYVDDELLLNYSFIRPRSRVTFNYNGPCTNIRMRVVNFSPRVRPYGGAGAAIIINHMENGKNVTYASSAKNAMQACAPGRCCEKEAAYVRPIPATGIVNPPDGCFPAYNGDDRNNRNFCNINKWIDVRASDLMATYPLCEFVAIGRMGAISVNPVDGLFPNLQTYGIDFKLPFCDKY